MYQISRVPKLLPAIALVLIGSMCFGMSAQAEGRKEALEAHNAGVTTVIDSSTEVNEEAIEQLEQLAEAYENNQVEESDLVMANVDRKLNVRLEPNEDSEKVGVLYKDCGGRILEQKDGWTRLKSGDLIGWASDEYLLFGEDALALADEVGNQIITISSDTLYARTEPSEDADVFAVCTRDDYLEYIEDVEGGWISVDYEGETCYVKSEYVDMDFYIDEGETMEAIRLREEEEKKAKLTANQGAVIVGGDDVRLLAALIYCEAGCESDAGKLAVGAAVMNRVRSGAYPDTVSGVIFASGQFTPALNGKVAAVYNSGPPESCYNAARAAIAGETNIGGATHFRRNNGTREGIVIDHQVFW